MVDSNMRVYSEKIDLDSGSIREFYDKRASSFLCGEKTCNTTVLLGDNNPGYADKWNEFEKKMIMPKLQLDSTKRVLDVGCGIGRWAESVLPLCKGYVGVDFSGEMIKAAAARFKGEENAEFKQASFLDIFDKTDIKQNKYDAVIIAGVSMYMNDSELKQCYEKLADILNHGAIIYIEESVGVEKRLTLNNIWSENLKSDYHAIYRTREEYREILAPLADKTTVLEDDYFNVLDKKELSETSHWYIILELK